MNTKLYNTSAVASAALVVAIVFAWSSPAICTVGAEPQPVFLTGEIDRTEIGILNGFDKASHAGSLIMTKKKKAGADDNPKPHGPFHRRIENPVPLDESASATGNLILFAKGKKTRADDDPKPEGRDDGKVQNPSSANQSASTEREGILLTKGKRGRNAPGGALDAPARKAPHAPGQAHG